MKIAVGVDNVELVNAFLRLIKEQNHEMVNVKVETALFDCIELNNADAYILSDQFAFAKKAIDFIKKESPHCPILLISHSSTDIKIKADVIVPYDPAIKNFVQICVHNVVKYAENFATLIKLTAKMQDTIEFGQCKYDPSRRTLYHKNKEVTKMSVKQGGLLEMLAVNYGEVVKKEIILERVWHKSDYFASRSMDVYITGLRKLFTEHEINLAIKKISNIGLILEHEDYRVNQ